MAKTKSILLNVPAEIYYKIKDQAELESRSEDVKVTIHDKMIKVLGFAVRQLKL